MTQIILTILTILLVALPASLAAQSAAKIAVVDFEAAIGATVEGKQAAEKFNVKFEERKKDLEARQKGLETAETALRTQERSLSEAARAERTRDIERRRTEITRASEDAQKELESFRDQLLRPIAEKGSAVMKALALEKGFTLVIDISGQNSVVYIDPAANVTQELTKRIDALPKPTPAKPPGN